MYTGLHSLDCFVFSRIDSNSQFSVYTPLVVSRQVANSGSFVSYTTNVLLLLDILQNYNPSNNPLPRYLVVTKIFQNEKRKRNQLASHLLDR